MDSSYRENEGKRLSQAISFDATEVLSRAESAYILAKSLTTLLLNTETTLGFGQESLLLVRALRDFKCSLLTQCDLTSKLVSVEVVILHSACSIEENETHKSRRNDKIELGSQRKSAERLFFVRIGHDIIQRRESAVAVGWEGIRFKILC